MTTLPFRYTPSNIRVPLLSFEVDPSRANTATQAQRTLIIAQKTSAGTAVADVPVRSGGVNEAKTAGGKGSFLALMTDWLRKRDPLGEVWYLPLADNGAGTAAAGSVKFTHVATAAGSLALYAAGMLVSTAITSSMTLANCATALVAAINANTDLPVTAAVNGGDTTQVDITCKHKGTMGNDIDLRLNYRGAANGEVTPTDLTVTITQLSGGATNPVLTTALGNCADMAFDFIVCGANDSTTLDALKNFLADDVGRWMPTRKIYGGMFGAKQGTVGTRTTFGGTRNSQHESYLGAFDSPTPAWLWAANGAGAAAASLRIDPALPLNTLALDVLAPPVASRDDFDDNEALLRAGMSTTFVDDAGTVHIGRMITASQTNATGQADDSFLDVMTPYTLMAVFRRLNGKLSSLYSRAKIVSDAAVVKPGSSSVQPKTIRATIVGEYRIMEEDDGWVQNTDAFSAGLIVEIDATNPHRVNILWAGILQPGLMQLAVLAQFRFAA